MSDRSEPQRAGPVGRGIPSPGPVEERIDLRGRTLRSHAARGSVVNSAFQIGLAGLGLLRRVVIAAFLTRAEFGIWGIIITTLLTLSWLKELGVADKYIQQSEPDQELAFQRAFTLELLLSLAFFALVAVVLPFYALAYGRWDIVVPGLVLALSVPISAFESPVWIAYRKMQFVRQRVVSAVDPVVTSVVTIGLGIAGAGYWSLVLGAVVGSVVGGAVATATSPYRLRLRFSRGTARQYASFSWPLLGYQLGNLVVIQGVLLVSARAVGIAGLGVIVLAASISEYADRVDGIVSQTIYPAVCAVADRRDLVYEAFLKSNRLALMWGISFGVALALFAGDLVHFGLGERWRSAIGVLAVVGVTAGVSQIAFNWQIFLRALNWTRPLFYGALVNVATFFGFIVPGVLAFGLKGYAFGFLCAVIVQIAVRGYFLRRVFTDFRLLPFAARAVAPSMPAVLAVLGARQVEPGTRTLAWVIVDLILYVEVTVGVTWLLERQLLTEMAGYLRGGGGGLRTHALANSPSGA